MIREHEETVKDPKTKVVITDTSDNDSNNVREYSIFIDDAYTISDLVEVSDPWNFMQSIKFTEGDSLNWFTTHIHYNGDTWEQTFRWNGEFKVLYRQDNF